nr:MAG TPA: hypothetical protein [Caudoviricetes sp.]
MQKVDFIYYKYLTMHCLYVTVGSNFTWNIVF